MELQSFQEAFLMLGLTDQINLAQAETDRLLNSNPHVAGIILHAYNLINGLRCTGFDEDDPETSENLVALPTGFVEASWEVMSFRYARADGSKKFIMKVVPVDGSSEIDVNALDLENEDKIYSCTISLKDIGALKEKLDSADGWAVEKGNDGAVVTKAYISQIFNPIAGKEKPEAAKKEEEKKQPDPSQPTPQMPTNPLGPFAPSGGGDLRNPRQPMPQVIGDPLDPLRIGGPRGGGIPGSHVGPNHPMFNPSGNPMVDPSIGGVPMWNDPEGGVGDLYPQFPGGMGRGRGGGPGFGPPRGGFGGGFGSGGGFGGPGGGFGGGGPGGFF